MQLQTKPDFERAAAEWQTFWAAGLDHPLISAIVPREGVTAQPKPSTYGLGPDLDVDAFCDGVLAWAETHEFLGAAIPFVYLEFAADQFATFLGADLTFTNDSEGGWSTHPYADEDLGSIDIGFQPDGSWWRHVSALARRMMQRLAGHVMIAAPTFVANLDCLVALRGSQQVLMDLVDDPDGVERALAQITAAHAEVFDAFAEVLEFATWGSINRHGMYSPGRINLPQCDFSCMISPAMFERFVLPHLRTEFERQGGGEYHLDGPGAIRHLPALSSIEGLGVIQWVAGAGNERQDWSDLYCRFDALGKGQIRGGRAEALEHWSSELQTRRLFWTLAAGSKAEAEAVLARYVVAHGNHRPCRISGVQ